MDFVRFLFLITAKFLAAQIFEQNILYPTLKDLNETVLLLHSIHFGLSFML